MISTMSSPDDDAVPPGPAQGFPPLLDLGHVPRGPVLVVAPHPDDEILGCGGAIARHAERGDPVHVVLVTRGEAGGEGDARLDESRRAAARLAGADAVTVHGLGVPDGRVAQAGDVAARLGERLAAVHPRVVYAPSPFEMHPDHVASLVALCDALARGDGWHEGQPPRLLLYEVNTEAVASFLLDVTPVADRKSAALRAFASQLGTIDIVARSDARARARTINVDLPGVTHVEAFTDVLPSRVGRLRADLARLAAGLGLGRPRPRISCVISTWNKRDAVLANVEALRAGTRVPDEIVVVDNASGDGTAAALRERFPDVVLVEQPHDRAGACETFNIGFRTATGELVAIMDDDVVATPDWLATLERHLLCEPESTAMVSSRVVEPGMPEAYMRREIGRGAYYASTFRGCGTLARRRVLEATGGYDERFFIYGNERDLSARVLDRGWRVLQVSDAVIHHATPFGMKAGRRSLYYHVRNFWLYAFKHCAWSDVVRVAAAMARRAWTGGGGEAPATAGRTGSEGDEELQATGTIGLGQALRHTPGAGWIVARATLSGLANLPYCLARRSVVRAPDFRPPGL